MENILWSATGEIMYIEKFDDLSAMTIDIEDLMGILPGKTYDLRVIKQLQPNTLYGNDKYAIEVHKESQQTNVNLFVKYKDIFCMMMFDNNNILIKRDNIGKQDDTILYVPWMKGEDKPSTSMEVSSILYKLMEKHFSSAKTVLTNIMIKPAA